MSDVPEGPNDRGGAGLARLARAAQATLRRARARLVSRETILRDLRDGLAARLGPDFVVRLLDRRAPAPVPRGGAILVFDMSVASRPEGHDIAVQLPDGTRLAPTDPAFAELPLPLQQLDPRCVAIVTRSGGKAVRVLRLERQGPVTLTQGRTVSLERTNTGTVAEELARLIDEEAPC